MRIYSRYIFFKFIKIYMYIKIYRIVQKLMTILLGNYNRNTCTWPLGLT